MWFDDGVDGAVVEWYLVHCGASRDGGEDGEDGEGGYEEDTDAAVQRRGRSLNPPLSYLVHLGEERYSNCTRLVPQMRWTFQPGCFLGRKQLDSEDSGVEL